MLILVTTVALGWLGIVLLMALFQDRLLFFPTANLSGSPTNIGLRHEEVMMPLDNGERIHGWFIHARAGAPVRGTLIFCHGNAGNISHRLASIRTFVALGLNVLIFDYEGYGRSSGRPTEAALYRDVEAAWKHVVEERSIPADSVVLFGRSLGAAAASWLASRVDCAGLIVESSFTSVPRLARELYPAFVIPALVRNKLENLEYVSSARSPVLVAHSRDDDLIPYHHGKQVFEAAPEPKWFLEMRGGHNDGPERTGKAYFEELERFLDRILDPGSDQ